VLAAPVHERRQQAQAEPRHGWPFGRVALGPGGHRFGRQRRQRKRQQFAKCAGLCLATTAPLGITAGLHKGEVVGVVAFAPYRSPLGDVGGPCLKRRRVGNAAACPVGFGGLALAPGFSTRVNALIDQRLQAPCFAADRVRCVSARVADRQA
jgi:hypothetical protein